MSAYLTVLRKECIDNFRDRRTILSSFSLAVLGPAFFVGLMSFVLSSALGESDEPLVITIAGRQIIGKNNGSKCAPVCGTSGKLASATVRFRYSRGHV